MTMGRITRSKTKKIASRATLDLCLETPINISANSEDEPIMEPTTPMKGEKDRENAANLLATPPGSIEKKQRVQQVTIIDTTPVKNSIALDGSLPSPCPSPLPQDNRDSLSPKKLIFGKNSLYSRTKAVLQRSTETVTNKEDGSLPTRKLQYLQILEFLNRNMEAHKSSSLYITGPPGTGKTAQVDSILKSSFLPIIPKHSQNQSIPKLSSHDLNNVSLYQLPSGKIQQVAVTSINCIALTNPSSIFTRIYEAFHKQTFNTNIPSTPVKTMHALQQFMEQYAQTTTFIVVLDELDKLVHPSITNVHSTKILFELFLLSRIPTVNFLLIGIANSLDMKDRFLSRLNLRQDLLPETLIFQPYSSDEMFQIIMDRINLVDPNESVFNPMAIKFAAKKCSGNTGDLRKLFDVLRRSIEIVELQILSDMKKNLNSNNTVLTKVGLPHIAKVFAQFMNSSSTKSRIGKLNMQQRIVLCCLVHRQKIDIFQSHCSLDDAYDYYYQLLKRKDSLIPLKRNEFLEICNALETNGVVTIFRGKTQGRTKHSIKMIKTTVDDKEFDEEINKMDLLKSLLIH
ncbi:AAA family ATPase CDC6 NDAI_0B00460 [Naumovozyma dairenensis CBS 421]|uniref:Cell division control protein n=1 Tax=Naumovozyma dairenensis (strain ATCC 10597 / BCRC 20456 / CBS 421 / NBRC 0211 / NRRL Y-12639) TaxID=1071378 RepID=G0W5L9_NAUDC|nr:hypothetical protein NDAI_0B00460 [Naumovozyma dairenensis CBS 421]CCD23080.1 hypothetical protein NDAI_0B00460 [Naumovozyma dairenensis CBS 421]